VFILKMGSLPELMVMTGPIRLKLRNSAPARAAGPTAGVSIILTACVIHSNAPGGEAKESLKEFPGTKPSIWWLRNSAVSKRNTAIQPFLSPTAQAVTIRSMAVKQPLVFSIFLVVALAFITPIPGPASRRQL